MGLEAVGFRDFKHTSLQSVMPVLSQQAILAQLRPAIFTARSEPVLAFNLAIVPLTSSYEPLTQPCLLTGIQ